MNPYDVILVTGANGFVGRNLVEYLQGEGFRNTYPLCSSDCDLTHRLETIRWLKEVRPNYVFHMAAMVFGIAGNLANQTLSYETNTYINTTTIEACRMVGVKKIVAAGTVAAYPDLTPPHFTEGMIFMGEPHASEWGYSHSKRGMLAHLEATGMSFSYPLFTNLYGPYDRFNLETGHVLPSLIRKFYEAKRDGTAVTIWGDGSQRRDFLHVSDCVRALRLIMDEIDGPVNLATGETHSLKEVADILSDYTGVAVEWDTNRPIGQKTRSYDVSKLGNALFSPEVLLADGLRQTFDWYCQNEATARKR